MAVAVGVRKDDARRGEAADDEIDRRARFAADLDDLDLDRQGQVLGTSYPRMALVLEWQQIKQVLMGVTA